MTTDWDYRADEAQLTAIVESSDDAIIAKDLSGLVRAWNRSAERLFGYTAGEMIGQPMAVIFPPDRLAEEAAILERIGRAGRIERYEADRCCRDGRIIRVRITVSPIRDASGQVVGATKIIRDLTGRDAKENRIRELQAEVVHLQRLSELGQFLSTLVHEVNQPLAAITNYIAACRRLVAAGNQQRIGIALERIEGQTVRTQEIVRRIRDFVHKRALEMQPENLSQVITEACALVRASVRDGGLRLTTQVDRTTAVNIDRIQVQQVLFNLLRNGIEAMDGLPRRELVVAANTAGAAMVEISVTDCGPGLPAAVRERLFQPFVTTKTNGMGVGLSVCRTIVEAHAGQLWADSTPGGGAVFRFTVPAAA